jgi:hypothetical protein
MIEATLNKIRDSFLKFIARRHEELAKLSTQELSEIVHRADELKYAEDFSVRVAAEIAGVGAQLELDRRSERKSKG